MKNRGYEIEYPKAIQEDARVWLDVLFKGWMSLSVVLDDRAVGMIFYNFERLRTEVMTDIRDEGYYCEGLVVVVAELDRQSVELAIQNLYETGTLARWSAGKFSF